MATVKLDTARLSRYLEGVFPNPKNLKNERALARAGDDRRRAADLFNDGKGNTLPGVAGSLWAAYNGVAEMVDYGPTRRNTDQRLTFMWFGAGANVKARAYEVALERMREWVQSA